MGSPYTKVIETSEYRWLLTIVASAALLRIVPIIAWSHAPEGDELAYLAISDSLRSGLGAVDNWGNRAMYNVGYPLLIVFPLAAVFGPDLLFVRLGNALLGTVSVLLTYFVAAEVGGGRNARLFAAALVAIYLPASIYATYILKENLLAPLVLATAWCALRLSRERSLGLVCTCGALVGLIALVGNAALTFGGAVVLAIHFGPGTPRAKVASFVLIAGVAVLVSLPWLVRNAKAIGAPVLNTNGGFNLYIGNNPAATGEFISIAETPAGADWEIFRLQVGELEASNALRSQALRWIREHPAEFAILTAKRAMLFWRPPVHRGKGDMSRAETLLRFVWVMQYVFIVALAAAAVTSSRTGPRRTISILACGIFLYFGVHTVFYVVVRYREPIMPILCVLAALTMERIANYIGRGATRI